MRARFVLVAAIAVMLLAPTALIAQEHGGGNRPDDPGQRADQPKVTGGGQIVADTEEPLQGPGDTVGFVARSTSDDTDDAQGRFVRLETSMVGGGEGPEQFFGEVTCLTVDGDTAQFGGVERDGEQAFTVDVVDNGEGGDADDDLILFRQTEEACAERDDDEQLALGRGNLVIHNGGGGEDG